MKAIKHPIDRTYEPAPDPRRIPLNLSLPEDLVAQLGRVAGPRKHSASVEQVLRRAIKREQLRVSIEGTARSLHMEHCPRWRTSEDVVAWVREMRAEVRAGTRQGELPTSHTFFEAVEFIQPGPDAAVLAGAWHERARRDGLHLSLLDALVASAAVAIDAAVLTRNVRDFAMTPVRVKTY